MSEPRIKVHRTRSLTSPALYGWWCTSDHRSRGWLNIGFTTIAAAADAGRRHLAEHHDATWLVAACECGVYPDPGICHCAGPGKTHCACSHGPICATRNALQTTHNESREGC